jgi:hypothetical protein
LIEKHSNEFRQIMSIQPGDLNEESQNFITVTLLVFKKLKELKKKTLDLNEIIELVWFFFI